MARIRYLSTQYTLCNRYLVVYKGLTYSLFPSFQTLTTAKSPLHPTGPRRHPLIFKGENLIFFSSSWLYSYFTCIIFFKSSSTNEVSSSQVNFFKMLDEKIEKVCYDCTTKPIHCWRIHVKYPVPKY